MGVGVGSALGEAGRPGIGRTRPRLHWNRFSTGPPWPLIEPVGRFQGLLAGGPDGSLGVALRPLPRRGPPAWQVRKRCAPGPTAPVKRLPTHFRGSESWRPRLSAGGGGAGSERRARRPGGQGGSTRHRAAGGIRVRVLLWHFPRRRWAACTACSVTPRGKAVLQQEGPWSAGSARSLPCSCALGLGFLFCTTGLCRFLRGGFWGGPRETGGLTSSPRSAWHGVRADRRRLPRCVSCPGSGGRPWS